MESGQLLSEATTLMMLGMGTVFVFLTVLVFVTTSMSSLITKFTPEPVAEPLAPAPSSPATDQHLLAVISAAIHAHRSRQ